MKPTTIQSKLKEARHLLLLEALKRSGMEADEIQSGTTGWDKTIPLPEGVFDLLKAYKDGRTELLAILVGPPGTGKTKVAAMCARLFVRPRLQSARSHGLMWLHEGTAAAQMGQEKSRNYGHSELPERAAYASLLVIDDLGVSDETETFEQILLRRYRERSPTIATINSLAEVNARLLSRFSGRGYDFSKLEDYRGR